MKKQFIVIVSCLLAASACTKRVENTFVEQQPPQRIVVEQHAVPAEREHVINKKRVVEERVDEFGRPIQQHSETTTEEYNR